MLILLATMALSLWAFAACEMNEAVRAAHEDDIREAVFRHQMLQNANASVYCLTLDYLAEGHHALSFVKRFEAHVPPVRLPSECTLDKERGYRVVQRDTAAEGVMLQLANIKWTKPAEVEVEGGYYRTPTRAEGYIYTVKREGSRWVVKEVKKKFSLHPRSSPYGRRFLWLHDAFRPEGKNAYSLPHPSGNTASQSLAAPGEPSRTTDRWLY